MARPSIGEAVTTTMENEKKMVIKELTILTEDSKESIYNLVFSVTKEDGIKNNE